ncbi:MAG: hypothetical protein CO099_06120 [Bdellovibrio sp. CG_4_9_14_3_um_filter_39_7]|nr:MAG: hypothetical protein CO099_06120 [Bdellovibrio sp. CG_4_9_14_3_um_filter_39_7]
MSEKFLKLGMSKTPPTKKWGINFGGGINSTTMIIECRKRGLKPDWILFADTGSEMPWTLEHVDRMTTWCKGWQDITVVRWERVKGEVIGFEPLHENCLRTGHLPSKAYGLAGCTSKWKIQPMDRWRKTNRFQEGSFAVGYDADESGRITSACKRGDVPNFTAWYPLVAWGIGREECNNICKSEGLNIGKSSCFMCPNMRVHEWKSMYENHPDLYEKACVIEENARNNGNLGRGGSGLGQGNLRELKKNFDMPDLFDLMRPALEDRCHHAGCFT